MKIRHALMAFAVALTLAGCAAHPVNRPAHLGTKPAAHPVAPHRPPLIMRSDTGQPLIVCDDTPAPCVTLDLTQDVTIMTTEAGTRYAVDRDTLGHWYVGQVADGTAGLIDVANCPSDDGVSTGACVWDATAQGNGHGTSFLDVAGDPLTYYLAP
jgi:hypothetical protein